MTNQQENKLTMCTSVNRFLDLNDARFFKLAALAKPIADFKAYLSDIKLKKGVTMKHFYSFFFFSNLFFQQQMTHLRAVTSFDAAKKSPFLGIWSATTRAGLTAIFLLALIGATAWGQTTYTWAGGSSGNWATSTNWLPERTSPASDQILVFNTSTIVTLDFASPQIMGELHITNNSYVVFINSSAHTINIGGGTGTDFQIDAGSTLVDSSDNTITIAIATGANGSVSGTFVVKGASIATAHRLTTTDATSLTFQSGSLCKVDTLFNGNLFGMTALNSVIFSSGSVYAQKSGSNPFGASQPSSVVVFQAGSLFRLDGNSNLSFAGRTYADFEDNTSGSTTVTGTSAVSINNLTITVGTLNFNMTGTGSSIKGNISVISGQTLNFSPASAGTVNLNGSSDQTISGTGTLSTSVNSTIAISNSSGVTLQRTINTSGAVTVSSSGVLNCGANIISGSGTFTLSSSAALGIGSSDGITTSGAAGNIQVSNTRTFDSGANYTYSGSSAQHTGNGLPSIVNNLTIDNSAGVTLDGNTTVGNTLTLANGNLTTGSHTLTLGANSTIDESGGAVTGKLMTTRNLSANNTNYTFGGMGLEIITQTTGNVPGSTQVKRVTGTALNSGENSSIKRYFDISSTTNSGLNANLVFHYREDELDGQNEATLQLFSAATTAGLWSAKGGTVDINANTLALSGINSFSVWTAADDNNDLVIPTPTLTLELFITSDPSHADSNHAVLYPQVGMGEGTVYDTDDWTYNSTTLTFYVVPVGSQSIDVSEFEINWDAAKANLRATKGNMFDFFATKDISTGKMRIDAGASSSLNEAPSTGKYLAQLDFNILRPGFNEITITGTDFRFFEGEAQQNVQVTADSGMIKFYLGDFASLHNVTTSGDGKINFEDLVQFALAYFSESDGEPAGYKAKFDIGPTNSSGSYFAMPNPDRQIQFEDLAIFSIGYGKSATLQLPKENAMPVIFAAQAPSVNTEGIVTVPLTISGAAKDVRALSISLTYPSSSLEYIGYEKSGEMNQEYCFMAAKAKDNKVTLDAAVIGIEHAGLSKEGTFAYVNFKQRNQSKNYDIRIQSVKARDSNNQGIPILINSKEILTADIPTGFALAQNYPNPFNPTTVISYQLPVNSYVTLKIFDLLGSEVATLVNERKDAGLYCVQWNASGFSSGIYFYQLQANEKRDVRKMVLMK